MVPPNKRAKRAAAAAEEAKAEVRHSRRHAALRAVAPAASCSRRAPAPSTPLPHPRQEVSSGMDAETPASPASGRPRRGAAAAADAPDTVRRHHRRQPGGGEISSQKDPEGGRQAALQPLTFPGRGRHAVDSEQIMEAVVKVLCIHTEPVRRGWWGAAVRGGGRGCSST
jgi:hypothetical protein